MPCKRCKEFYKQYPIQENGYHHLKEGPFLVASAPIKCGFDENGEFKSDNWGCRTLISLRYIAQTSVCKNCYYYRDDLVTGTLCVIPIPILADYDIEQSGFIILAYYKERGKTDIGVVIDDEGVKPLKLNTAEKVLEYYECKLKEANDE